MLNNKDILNQSLVNHMYFASSIRSFCTTIGLTFFKNNQDYIDRAIAIGREATEIINQALEYMDQELANDVIKSDTYITPYSMDLALLTEELFEINLEIAIDKDKEILNTRKNITINDDVMNKIYKLNEAAERLINKFLSFVIEIRDKLSIGELFSYIYPDYFNYMYEEISVYQRDLARIKTKEDYTNFYINEYNYYFNELLRKTGEYLRGFLDTTHQDVFDLLSYYIDAFSKLIEKYLKNKNDLTLTNETERLVSNYKNFITDIIERLLKSELYFITPPISLDNFLTNINVYLYIIDYIRKGR